MVFWHGTRTVHSIGQHFRRAIHTGFHAIRSAVTGAVQAAPHVARAIEDARGVYQKVKPLLQEKGYGHHTNRIDTHLSTYDRVRRALE
jgi:phage-related protein